MRSRLSILAGIVIFGLALTAAASPDKAVKDKDKAVKDKDKGKDKAVKDKDNAAKIIGVWEVVKSEAMPPGATLKFTKDNKIEMSAKFGDKALTIDGTYKVKEDKLEVTLNLGGKTRSDSATIKKLTATELQLQDEKGIIADYKKK